MPIRRPANTSKASLPWRHARLRGRRFALGFFCPTNFPTDSNNSLYIGIWYYNIPERTVVWVANRDNPIITPSSSAKLVITNGSQLVLSDSQGRSIWTTTNNAATTTTATGDDAAGAVAVLLDSGNFALRSSNGTDIWQSFDHPTDTILPTMRVPLRYRPQMPGRLVAWKGPDDPSTGDFSSGVDPNTSLQFFIWHGSWPYYRTTMFHGFSVSGDTHRGNTNFIIYQTITSAGDAFVYRVSEGGPYTRVLLDYTGKLRLLSWDNATLSWTMLSESPGDCNLYASCGPFGYCDNSGDSPTCRCLDGFEPVNSLSSSQGCRRKNAVKCGMEDRFETLPGWKVPDNFLQVGNRSFEQCAAECSRNCSCTAYAYANLSSGGTTGGASRCLVWNEGLIDMGNARFAALNLYLRRAESPGKSKTHFFHLQ